MKRSILSFLSLAAAFLVLPAPAHAVRFVRGDADGSKEIDISDAIHILSHLFLGAPAKLACDDAADVDDNGEKEVTDAVYLLIFDFLGGLPPPEPYPFCGPDRTADSYLCESFDPCVDAPCGGFVFRPCDDLEVCDPIPGACGGADLPGECVSLPADCPQIYEPVCGCDGQTYSNDCERLKAGVQKNHDGPCDQVQICGGRGVPPCAKGFFCEFPDGTCGAADEAGVCRELPPPICPLFFKPVCGCDNQTYGNDCERRAAGISKLHDGPCEGGP
ncbi:MAG: hypothetical protein HY717_16145 [Planctomycetes bacterium]|nr:hypothetical protein [Planctomycetota bacterium]